MWTFIWLVLGAVFLWMALHPFITYPVSLLLAAKQELLVKTEGNGHAPSITICTCAYNEVTVIEEKIRNLLVLRQSYPGLDVSVYVDGANDGTAEIVERYAHVLRADISKARHGKTHGMNRLVATSDTDLIVFTDANVFLANDALKNLVQHFDDPSVGCVCGHLIYTNPDDSVTAATGSRYWRLEQFIKQKESNLGSVMGADGSIFAIRRALHRPPPDHIIDDMFVSFQVLCSGYKVIQVDDVRAFEKSVSAPAEEYKRKVRIACQAFNVHRLIWPDLRTHFSAIQMYMYVSHKLMRWFSIFFLAVGFTCVLAALIAAHLALVALSLFFLTGAAIYVGSHWHVPLLSGVIDVFIALWGTGVGVIRSLRGERFQTWQPASSIRN